MNTFAQRLKYARARAQMSQEELARKLDITKSAISKVEMGLTHDVVMTTLFAMADALSIDARWLATGKAPVGDSAIGVPGETGLLEAWSKLPTDLREPLKEMIEKSAVASDQRYWQWIAEKDNR
jgi:transcriptional regulator with XRE-family HTH domain